VDYFAQRGLECPQFSNPADYFFMSVFNGGDKKTGDDTTAKETFRQLLDVWPTTTEGKQLQRAVDAAIDQPRTANAPMPPNTFMAGFGAQLRFLLGRGSRNAVRNPMVVRAKFMQIVVFAIIADIVYWQIPDRDFKGQVQDRAGALFFILLNLLMANAMNNLTVFSAEKLVFQREHHARMYGLPAYFMAKTLIDLPLLILMPVIYVSAIYFAVGLQLSAAKFLILMLGAVLISNCGAAIGFWAAATFSNLSVALASIPLIIIPLMIFSGLFVNLATLPVWIRWFQWLSPIKYGFVAFMKNEFDGLTIGCKDTDGPTCRPLAGDMVIDSYGFSDKGSIAVNMIALGGFWILLWALAYVGLWNAVRKAQGTLKHVEGASHKDQMGIGAKQV
jgi:ATP-binding cassette subfamily G (WHITE) protein 1